MPSITHMTVTFSCTIPTQAYGNVGTNVAWSGDLLPGETPEEAQHEIFGRIREQVTKDLMPIARAKLQQSAPVIMSLPKAERDALIQSLGLLQWAEIVAPELKLTLLGREGVE